MTRFLSCLLLLCAAGCAATPSHSVSSDHGRITVSLFAPGAGSVEFLSSQDCYRPHPLRRNDRGVWTMNGLADTEFRYFYIVDGIVHLPDCRYREADDFGQVNCIHQPGRDTAVHRR